jgi:hypothetical protein
MSDARRSGGHLATQADLPERDRKAGDIHLALEERMSPRRCRTGRISDGERPETCETCQIVV